MEKGKQILKELLNINAIKLSIDPPYQWSSGWKSPIYCDNRLSLSFPNLRNLIIDTFIELITKQNFEFNSVAGVATAGIPYASILADRLKQPLCYVRTDNKKHGLKNKIEGQISHENSVIVIEDVVSTGKSSLNAIQALKDRGVEIKALLCVYTYGFKETEDLFLENEIPLFSLANYNQLIELLKEDNSWQESSLELLKKWNNNPSDWKID